MRTSSFRDIIVIFLVVVVKVVAAAAAVAIIVCERRADLLRSKYDLRVRTLTVVSARWAPAPR